MTTSFVPWIAGSIGAAAAGVILDRSFKISNDLKMLKTLVGLKWTLSRMERNGLTIADRFEETADKNLDKRAIVFVNTGAVWTFRDLEQTANRVAHWAISRGLRKGDVVALFMTNRPEFIATWLGLAKAGVVCAFINHNLKGSPLMHCFKVSSAKAIIFDEDLRGSIEDVRADINALNSREKVLTATYGGSRSSHAGVGLDIDLNRVLPTLSKDRPSLSFRKGTKITDTFGFVYTSGTTGMPKAAIISHLRLSMAGGGFLSVYQVRPDDVCYTVLPLYHSAGGMIGAGMLIFGGVTMVLRDKFSTTNFWPDVAEFKCTVFQYIGELCRYLLLAKSSPMESKHNIRIAIGNGLRPDIWDDFQTRFNIPEVGEFYGSTEGNVALFNHCKTEAARGAVGVAGGLLRLVGLNPIVRFDDEAEEPVRNKAGFCVQCGPDEVGEMLGWIKEGDPTRDFQGYHGNESATKKKIITDVFKKGDKYFRTGDLLRMDADGYYHFVDRIGDTFRWKGENVATTEVAEVLSGFPGIREVNVYGVAVPGKDGRAGMAALTLSNEGPGSARSATGELVKIDLVNFAAHCRKNLPSYAQPVFVRILPEVPITGTFKHQKVALRKEGADPSAVSDPLFWRNPSSGAYEPLDDAIYQRLATNPASKL